jgi:uncharacterized membrane protein YdjX (TVP38/TMEM64 family)
MISRRIKLLLVVLLLAGLAGAILAFRVSPAEIAAAMKRAVETCREAGPWAFFTAMALLPTVGFPLSAFTLTAGPVFGPTLGIGTVIACSLLAIAINVAFTYWIAARLFHPLIERLVVWMGYRLPRFRSESAWSVALIVRLVPGPPFFLQSYLLGLARLPFGIYMAVSVLVPSVYAVGVMLFGDALARGDRTAMIVAAVILLIAGAVMHQLRKRMAAKKAAAALVDPSPAVEATRPE